MTHQSYIVVSYPESLPVLRDIRQLHPQVLVPTHPTMLKAIQAIAQIILGVVGIPRRGHHHHVDRVRRVKHGERFATPSGVDVPQHVGDSGIQHQSDSRDGNYHIHPYRRVEVPSHSCDHLIATQGDLCLGRNGKRVH